jgi:hypothetical protein
MAKIGMQPRIEMELTLIVTEEEARALDAMAGYGDDAFVKVFYAHLGKAYMERHEAGLRSFLKSCRELIPGPLSRATAARKTFAGIDR